MEKKSANQRTRQLGKVPAFLGMDYLVAAVVGIEGFPADCGADDLVLRESLYSPAHSRLALQERYYREQIPPRKDYALGPKWLVKL